MDISLKPRPCRGFLCLSVYRRHRTRRQGPRWSTHKRGHGPNVRSWGDASGRVVIAIRGIPCV